jgi:hypothetical protein
MNWKRRPNLSVQFVSFVNERQIANSLIDAVIRDGNPNRGDYRVKIWANANCWIYKALVAP